MVVRPSVSMTFDPVHWDLRSRHVSGVGGLGSRSVPTVCGRPVTRLGTWGVSEVGWRRLLRSRPEGGRTSLRGVHHSCSETLDLPSRRPEAREWTSRPPRSQRPFYTRAGGVNPFDPRLLSRGGSGPPHPSLPFAPTAHPTPLPPGFLWSPSFKGFAI